MYVLRIFYVSESEVNINKNPCEFFEEMFIEISKNYFKIFHSTPNSFTQILKRFEEQQILRNVLSQSYMKECVEGTYSRVYIQISVLQVYLKGSWS